jgi:general secretion pathway protein C
MGIKQLLLIANLLLIAAALYLGVKGVYGYMTFHLDTAPAVETPAATSAEAKQAVVPPFSEYSTIASRNLFHTKTGADSKTKPQSELKLDALDQTKLKLKLWGTVDGTAESAYAVIEEETGREQKLYRVGDTIQDAEIKMILRNKVVLTVAGKDEILEMEKLETGATGTNNLVGQADQTGVLSTSVMGANIAQRRITLNRDQITGAMSNLNELMGQINIQPNVQDGQTDGMLLNNIKPNSIFRRMGLRNGDVLTAVDGTSITSVDDALKLYENLKSADTTKLEIKRKGRPTVIEYSIR